MKVLFFLLLLLIFTESNFAWSQYYSYENLNLAFYNEETQSRLNEIEDETREAADKAQEAQDSAEEAKDRANEIEDEARQEAEDRAEAQRIIEASNRSFVYMLIGLVVIGVSLHKMVKNKKQNREDKLKASEKAGIFIIIFGVILAVTAVILSESIFYDLDIIQYIMQANLRIGWFHKNIPTKYIILACIILISYGVIIYLEIFSPPKSILSKFEDS